MDWLCLSDDSRLVERYSKNMRPKNRLGRRRLVSLPVASLFRYGHCSFRQSGHPVSLAIHKLKVVFLLRSHAFALGQAEGSGGVLFPYWSRSPVPNSTLSATTVNAVNHFPTGPTRCFPSFYLYAHFAHFRCFCVTILAV